MMLRALPAVAVVLLSAAAACAQGVTRVRLMLPERPSVPVQQIAQVLARQIAQRCAARLVTDEEAPLVIELAITPGIGPDAFRLDYRPGGGITICGGTACGLLYGVGMRGAEFASDICTAAVSSRDRADRGRSHHQRQHQAGVS